MSKVKQMVNRENVEILGYFGNGFNENLEKPTPLKEALSLIAAKYPETKDLEFHIRFTEMRVRGGCYCLDFARSYSKKALEINEKVSNYMAINSKVDTKIGFLKGYRSLYVSQFLGTPFMLAPGQKEPVISLLSEEDQEEMKNFYLGNMTHYFLNEVKALDKESQVNLLAGALMILSGFLPKEDTFEKKVYPKAKLNFDKVVEPISETTDSEYAEKFVYSLFKSKDEYDIRCGLLKGIYEAVATDFPKEAATQLVESVSSHIQGSIHLSLVDALMIALQSE